MNSEVKILVCDDEPHIVHVVSSKLRNAGFEVITAVDGEEAFAVAQQEQPQLIITDYQMPFLSGLELCTKLRSTDGLSDVPVIMRTLGTMIQSGVSMLEGVQLTKNVCKSLSYQRMWDEVNQRVEAGRQISDALASNQQIPRSVLKMLDAGERSGKLGEVMNRVAGFCEEELDSSLKQMTSMIEPAIVTFLGIVVGGLVLAMLLPIFTISKAIH